MKLENVVYIFIFVILNCITKITFAGLNENDFVLSRIQNDTRTCISEDIFEHKKLKNCVILMPDEDIKGENFLVLQCMSLYDSFLRLCEKPLNNKLKEKIPQDLKEFNNLVDSQRNQTVDKFCTAKENGNLVSRNESFNKTAPWVNFFINSIKDKVKCSQICSTIDGTLEPLCALIVWGNQLYSETRNTADVPQAAAKKIDDIHENNEKSDHEQIPSNVKKLPPVKNEQTFKEKSDHEQIPSNVKELPPVENEQTFKEKSDNEQIPSNVKKLPPVKNEQTFKDTTYSNNTVGANTNSVRTNPQSKPEPPARNEENSKLPPGKKMKETNVQETLGLAPENQKNRKPTTNNNSPTVEENGNNGSTRVNGENKKTTEIKESAGLDQSGPQEEIKETPEISVLENDFIEKPFVTPTQSKMNINDGNVKDTNEDGDIAVSNEEENNENGGEMEDGNVGADGVEHDEESDDMQIPSSVKESPVPVQNKQTVKEPAAHAAVDINTIVETDVEGDVILRGDPFVEAEESHFFTYFISMAVLSIIAYLVFHNKKKLVALAVEGRRTRSTTRRRPNTASYSKLDCNLEEAMVSNTTASVTHVLY